MPAGWAPFRDAVWPGLVLLADRKAGGYCEAVGFTGSSKHVPGQVVDVVGADTATGSAERLARMSAADSEGHDEDPLSSTDAVVSLADHTRHVAEEAGALCEGLGVDAETKGVIARAARWHDVGKAHEVFQDTMRRGLGARLLPPTCSWRKPLGLHGMAEATFATNSHRRWRFSLTEAGREVLIWLPTLLPLITAKCGSSCAPCPESRHRAPRNARMRASPVAFGMATNFRRLTSVPASAGMGAGCLFPSWNLVGTMSPTRVGLNEPTSCWHSSALSARLVGGHPPNR